MGIDYNNVIVSDGLVLYIDAANPRSYSGIGLTANGLIGGIGGTLVNGTGFSSSNNGSFIFDGTNDYIYAPINTNLFSTQATMIMWLKNDIATPPQAQTGIMGYFGAGGGIDHYPWPDGAAGGYRPAGILRHGREARAGLLPLVRDRDRHRDDGRDAFLYHERQRAPVAGRQAERL
jgi:hypothetical protein